MIDLLIEWMINWLTDWLMTAKLWYWNDLCDLLGYAYIPPFNHPDIWYVLIIYFN